MKGWARRVRNTKPQINGSCYYMLASFALLMVCCIKIKRLSVNTWGNFLKRKRKKRKKRKKICIAVYKYSLLEETDTYTVIYYNRTLVLKLFRLRTKKIIEIPKGLLFMWVVSSIFTIVEIKTEKNFNTNLFFKKPLHIHINFYEK